MSKTIITLFAVSMVLVALPIAAADETKADCEPNQMWTGYTTTEAIKNAYYALLAPSDPRMKNCEGEHWDGQDSVAPAHNPGNTGTTGCSASAVMIPGGASVARCMNSDINNAGANTGNPLVFRVSTTGRESYVGLDIANVGRVAAYNGVCLAGDSIEGATCTATGFTRTAIYLRDNTDQATGGTNVLATAVSAAGLTKGHASEADCTQNTYNQGATSNPPNRDLCGRDNTAITVEMLLP